MNISKKILLGSFIGLAFASCANEGFPTSEEGTMSLSVNKVAPAATRAVETADFPVAVYSLNTNQVIASYKRADEVPSKIKMKTGEYYAEAHSPLQLKKIMDAPYYAGCDTFEILQNINTISNVVCRMANGSITVRFSDDFMTVFKSWTVLLAIAAALLAWTFLVPIAAGIAMVVLMVIKIICFFQVCKGKAKEPAIVRSLGFLN